MTNKTMEEKTFSTLALGSLKREMINMIQQEAREISEGKDYASRIEWGDWFKEGRLVKGKHKK